MSVLCRGKTSASSRRLRQCVSHTKSPFIQPAQSFDEAVDVPVALHDRQKAVSSTGPVHWQVRRFPSCVATPSTNNPDDTAKVLRVRQRQSTTNQKIQKIAEVPQVVQRQCGSPNDPECREDPAGPILDRFKVAPVGIQRQTPTIQSPQQPLASLSVSRLAGSSDTQNVCRMTKSRNRTGSRAWRKSSAYRPPAHAVAAAGADSKDPEVHSAVQADESLTKSAFPKVEVLYVVMGCSETSVLSARRRRGAKPPAVAAAAQLRMVQQASAVWRPASLVLHRASSTTARCVLYGGRAADKVAPNDSVARTIAAAKPSWAQKPKNCTAHRDGCPTVNMVRSSRPSLTTRVRLGRFRRIPERRDGCNVQTVQTTELPNSSRVPFNQHSQANTTSQRVESKAAGVTFQLRSGGTSGCGRDTTTLYAQSGSSREKRLESQSPQPNEVYELSTQSSRTPSSRSPPLKTEK